MPIRSFPLRLATLLTLIVACTTADLLAQIPELWRPAYFLPPTRYGTLEFGDYDRDGDLDLFLSGQDNQRLWGRIFTTADSAEAGIKVTRAEPSLLAPLWQSDASWGSLDNEGFLDLATMGLTERQEGAELVPVVSAQVYSFSVQRQEYLLQQSLQGAYNGSIEWGDYDNDGDQDLLLTGATSLDPPYDPVTLVYENTGGVLGLSSISLPAVAFGKSKWVDYDGDNDLDAALMGINIEGETVFHLMRNDGGGTFTEVSTPMQSLVLGSMDWGDYDNDGDPDLLLSGGAVGPSVLTGRTLIYRNDGAGQFVEVPATGLPQKVFGQAKWGDFDGDGDLDLFIAGQDGIGVAPGMLMIENVDGTAFKNLQFPDPDALGALVDIKFSGLSLSTVSIADYNGDGDVDLVVSGDLNGQPILRFFINVRIIEPLNDGWAP